MEPNEDESNWTHACRVLGLDSRGLFANADGSIAQAWRPGLRDGSPDLQDTSLIAACGPRQLSTTDA